MQSDWRKIDPDGLADVKIALAATSDRGRRQTLAKAGRQGHWGALARECSSP
jgi:hypothetical protein